MATKLKAPPILHPWHPTKYRSLEHVEQLARNRHRFVLVMGHVVKLPAPRLTYRVGGLLLVQGIFWGAFRWQGYMMYDSEVWARWMPEHQRASPRLHEWSSSAICECCGRSFHGSHVQTIYVGAEHASLLDYVICPSCDEEGVIHFTRGAGYLASYALK